MTTTPTPAQRLDALCGALGALHRQEHRNPTLHPLLDLARIVRDLHRDAEPPQERPEIAPEGDGTTGPGSGRETGAQRYGSHRPGHAFTPAVEPPPLAPGRARITMHDTTVDWPRASGMRIQTIGSDYLRFVADARPAGAPSRMPSEPETGSQRDGYSAVVGDRVRVMSGENGYRPARCWSTGVVVEHGFPGYTVRFQDGVENFYAGELLEVLPADAPGARRFKLYDRVRIITGESRGACGVIRDVIGDGDYYDVDLGDGVGYGAGGDELEPLPPVEHRVISPSVPQQPDWTCSGCAWTRPILSNAVSEMAAEEASAAHAHAEAHTTLPTPDEVELLAHVASRACQERDEALARIDRAWSLVTDYRGLGVPAGMLADALGAPLDDAGDVPAVEPTPDDPTPVPVSLPTTPGSVAWTRDGSVHGLTDGTDATPWFALDGPAKDGYASAGWLHDLGVVRVFDAGAGQIRVLGAGTVAPEQPVSDPVMDLGTAAPGRLARDRDGVVWCKTDRPVTPWVRVMGRGPGCETTTVDLLDNGGRLVAGTVA